MRQTLLEAERIIGHHSNRIIYPTDYYPTCRECNEFASYEVLGRYYCSSCIWDIAEEALPFEADYCEYCGEDIEGECIKIFGDFYHPECFNKSYEID